MPQDKDTAASLLPPEGDEEQEAPRTGRQRPRYREAVAPEIPREEGGRDQRGFVSKAATTVGRGAVKGLITEPLDMIGDVGEAIGFGEGFDEALDAPGDFVDTMLPKVEGGGWAVAEGLIQFTVPFLATAPAAALIKGTKAVQAVRGAQVTQAALATRIGKFGAFTAEAGLRGAVVDFSSFDPAEMGLSEMAAETNIPILSDLGNALSVHDTDSRLEGRFKRMGEGALLGTAADGIMYGVRGVFRARMATRMETAIQQGLAKPSDVIKRDLRLAEAGSAVDPMPAQASAFYKNGRIEAFLEVDTVNGGFKLGDANFETLDAALKAAKKAGLQEETLYDAAQRYTKGAADDMTRATQLGEAGEVNLGNIGKNPDLQEAVEAAHKGLKTGVADRVKAHMAKGEGGQFGHLGGDEALRRDVRGVFPGEKSNLDTTIDEAPSEARTVYRAFEETRRLLRQRFGEKITLYRADAPEARKVEGKHTVNMAGTEEFTQNFRSGDRGTTVRDVGKPGKPKLKEISTSLPDREVKPHIVDVDDIVAMNVSKNGNYVEYVVINPETRAATRKILLDRTDEIERITKELLPDAAEATRRQKIAASKITPQVVESFQRNLDDVSKALDNVDEKALPTAIEKMIDEFHMNWRHYMGRDGDVAAPILLMDKLVKKATLKDKTLLTKVNKWLKDPSISKNAAKQAEFLAEHNKHEAALVMLTSEAVFAAQSRHVADLSREVAKLRQLGQAHSVERGTLRAAMLDMVRLQKEIMDHVGQSARATRARRHVKTVQEATLTGKDIDVGEMAKLGDEVIEETPFPTMPFKEAEEWVEAMTDDELLAFGELVELMGGKAPNLQAIIESANVREGDMAGNLWDAMMEWQTAGLLSGPRTWAKILVSNIAVGAVETVIAPAAGSVVGRNLDQQTRRMMRLKAQSNIYGFFAYMEDATAAAKAAWKHNLPVADPYTVRNVISGDATSRVAGETAGKAVRNLGKGARTSFRIINTLDTYSKVIIAKSQARSMALEKALRAGQTMDQAVEYAERMASATIDRNTGIIMFEPGRKLGNKVAMMSPMSDGEVAKGLIEFVEKTPLLQPFVKFVRPAASLLAYTAEGIPGSEKFVRRIRMELEHGGPEAAAQLRAKRLLALTTIGSLTAMFASDNVTAQGPTDPALREEWLNTHRPYSVRVGGRWLNYIWMPGIGPLTGMTFSALEAMRSGHTEMQTDFSNTSGLDVGVNAVGALVRSVMEQSYLQGLVAFAEMTTGTAGIQDGAARLARGFTFAPLTQALSFDPYYRDADGFTEQVKATVPGLSRQIPSRYDAYGRPLESAYSNPLSAADPTKLTQPVKEVDSLTVALEELRQGQSAPDRFFDGNKNFDLHSQQWMEPRHKLTPWERFNQIIREGEGDGGLRQRQIEVVEDSAYRPVIDQAYREKLMASGQLTEEDYSILKKGLRAELLGMRRGAYQEAYALLRDEYPRLDDQLGLYIEAKGMGLTK